MKRPGSEARINLKKAVVMVIETSEESLEMTSQVLKGFGVGTLRKFLNVAEAKTLLQSRSVDLIVIDPTVGDGAGYDFIRDLRRSGWPSASVPIMLVAGHLRKSDVERGRDVGVNCVVLKPATPDVLLNHLIWVARDKRPFVKVSEYVGPDRRFKFEGPPEGTDGRRQSDLLSPLTDTNAPNLSPDELDAMFKPQRVAF